MNETTTIEAPAAAAPPPKSPEQAQTEFLREHALKRRVESAQKTIARTEYREKVTKLRPWLRRLAKNAKTDEVYSDLANAVMALSYADEWQGVLAFNEFANRIEMRKMPPWGSEYSDPAREAEEGAGAFVEEDAARTAMWLAQECNIRVPPAVAYEALRLVAMAHRFHPVRAYFDSLVWDRKPRLASWLTTYAGTEDTLYASSVGMWWLVSAVARIRRPGCKAHHMLILEGIQGAGKSSLVEILAKGWFSDTPLEIGNKDAYGALRGSLIVEWGELDNMSRASVSALKTFLTSGTDRYRPPYGRIEIQVPRQGVFFGTVNGNKYFMDTTGARRFWPVAAASARFDLDALRRDVDQLWAEAVAAYAGGTQWWPDTDEEREMCAVQQLERHVDDVWADKITNWIYDQRDIVGYTGWITTRAILEGCLSLAPDRQDSKAERRVAAVMHKLEWANDKTPRNVNPDRPRAWCDPDPKRGRAAIRDERDEARKQPAPPPNPRTLL